MYAIILISHSEKITMGLKEMIEEMAGPDDSVRIISAGGTGDGRLGTNSVMILNHIMASRDCQNILIFTDMGSAILSAEMAIDLIQDKELHEKIYLIDAPLIEGSFIAAVHCAGNSEISEVLEELQNM